MKQTLRRGLAMLFALMLCIGLLPMLQPAAEAAEFEYVYDSTGKYIYNWGTRGETATSLSPNAEAFYTDGFTYDVLSAYSGGTGISDAPDSELYEVLQDFMASNHSYETSYAATRDLYQYTDCQNSGLDSKVISSFYSGNSIGPAWDSGKTWNREHTWPNSKGLGGNDENDIMMLRPTAKSENGARGNKAYGESSGYYYPNSESNGAYDVRGDVARIFLYVYVRWGNVDGNGSYDTWGSRGVIESLDVLLKWMEEDPVDTWELGRNDSVESITGTRNVFVDYPELAFLLFGAEVPSDMTTPSGEASSTCGHNNFKSVVTAPTCEADGYTTYTCQSAGCGYSYTANVVKATGHSYANGVCTVCGDSQASTPAYGVVEAPATNTAYKFGMIQENVSTSDVYYLAGGMNGYYMATTTNKDAAIDVYLEATTGGYYFYTYVSGVKTYINMVVSGTHVNGAYETTATTVYTYDTDSKTLIAQVNGKPYWFGTRNDKTYTTVGPCATSYNGFYCQFYGDLNVSGDEECKHTSTKVEGAVEATCGKAGHTGKTVCADCGEVLSAGEVIPATGKHTLDTTGHCTGCDYYEAPPVCEHKNSELRNQKAATCGAEGYTGDTCCTQCNAVISAGEAIPATGEHTLDETGHCTGCEYFECTHANVEHRNQSDATCGTDGHTGDVYCADCGEFIAGGSVIPATGEHNYGEDGKCAGCGAEYKCPHTNTVHRGKSDPTCGTDGYTGDIYCADCLEFVAEGEAIPATGTHAPGEWATTADGTQMERCCSVCGGQKEYKPLEESDAGLPWIWIGVGAGAIVIVGVAIVILRKKKK